MAEELDDFPQAFLDDTRMPWELPEEPLRWQWGADKGKALREIDSRELLRKRRWLEAKNGAGHYFDALLAEIETVLMERQGL